MKKLVLALVAVMVAVVGAAAAMGAPLTADEEEREFNARLEGFQETPAISTTGNGRFKAKLTNATTLEFELSFANLEGGNVLFAHIHLGQRSVAGGVSAFLCGGGTKPACPASGTVKGTITPADIIGPTGQGISAGEFEELVRAMREGVTYANVHTVKFPTGEVRGQIRDHD